MYDICFSYAFRFIFSALTLCIFLSHERLSHIRDNDSNANVITIRLYQLLSFEQRASIGNLSNTI